MIKLLLLLLLLLCIRAKYSSFNGRDLVHGSTRIHTTFPFRTRPKTRWGVRLGPLIWIFNLDEKRYGTVFSSN